MQVSKRDRINEVFKRMREAGPFRSDIEARLILAETMKDVEDKLSGIPENPYAAAGMLTDGRMYPPDDKFERPSGSSSVRVFRQRGHLTRFGKNGSLRIEGPESKIEIDLPGEDGRTVEDLLNGN